MDEKTQTDAVTDQNAAEEQAQAHEGHNQPDEIAPDAPDTPVDDASALDEAPEHDIVDAQSAADGHENPPENMPETPAAQDTAAAPDEIQATLSAAQQEAQKNLDLLQRTRAEFVNYKKRTERELNERHERGVFDALTQMLPIMDDFERALENVPEHLQDEPWVSGVSMILRKFDKILEQYHVRALDPVGETFDPRQHEAIGMDDTSDYESGQVTVTLQKGYASEDRVLRPALVRVAN